MEKYIDANKLKKHYAWWRGTENGRKMADLFDEIVDAQPPADMVEVVRCKKCKYHDDEEPGKVYCFCPDRICGWVSEDFFCGNGRKE